MTAVSDRPGEASDDGGGQGSPDEIAAPLAKRELVERRKTTFDEIGDIVQFVGLTLRDLPGALKYPSEVIRQLAVIVKGSTVVITALLLVDGVLVGEIGHYLLQQIGAQSYVGLFAAAGTLKGSAPIFFGFMVAAKIACGFSAELGAMKINEEIDALTVMGIPAQTYLVGTRVLAYIIAAPFLWAIGIAVCFYANYVTNVVVLGSVSSGGYTDVLWAFTTPTDLFVRSLLWAVVPSIIVVIVGCYFGMTATNGPVGVGDNTARSMVYNIVFISVFGAGVLFQFTYGTTVVVPIAN